MLDCVTVALVPLLIAWRLARSLQAALLLLPLHFHLPTIITWRLHLHADLVCRRLAEYPQIAPAERDG